MILKTDIRKLYAVFFTAVLLISPLFGRAATIPIDKWKLHPSYSDAVKVVRAWGRLYVLSDGSLYSTVIGSDMVELYTYDKNGGLSDFKIADIAYCESVNTLVLAYSNGNLDLLFEDDEMAACPDIVMGNPGTVNIGKMLVDGKYVYIPIGAGLVKFNLEKREISGFYRFTSTVSGIAEYGGNLFCVTADSIMTANPLDNLLDPASWTTCLKGKYTDIVSFDGSLFAFTGQNRLFRILGQDGMKTELFMSGLNAVPHVEDGIMYVCQDSLLKICYSSDNMSIYRLSHPAYYATGDNDMIWTACAEIGLDAYFIDADHGPALVYTGIKPQGPRRNAFHFITWPEPGHMLAISGCQNYQGIVWPGTVMTYYDSKWDFYDENVSKYTNQKYIDLTEAAQDPQNPDRVFVGSARQGLYEFDKGKFARHYTWDNSGLTSILENNRYNYVSVSSLMFDKSGNLWMTNNEVDTIIKILKTDGSWTSLYFSEISDIPTFKQMKQDRNGIIWLNSSRGLHPGIVAIDYGGTIDYPGDDAIRFSGSTFTNQDGKTEEIYDLFAYDFDLDGVMWLCTNRGIFVLKEPSKFISTSNPVFERVKINRNDGSGLADYLFEGVMTTAIHIDEGNRKWIGTMNNGIYLISADGTQTISHFTVDNSPLPSNNILCISEDARDGSIFIATELGLVQYGGQARQPEITLQKSNMSVYPNPVMSQDDYVTITGLADNTIVKITNVKGKLVYQGISLGGSISWNLKDAGGHNVPSGVYHAIATFGKTSSTVNITVIR